MFNAKALKHCPGYSTDRDMPEEIVDARKRLWGKFKDTKKENPVSSVRIVYPAKLLGFHSTESTNAVVMPVTQSGSDTVVDSHVTLVCRHFLEPRRNELSPLRKQTPSL